MAFTTAILVSADDVYTVYCYKMSEYWIMHVIFDRSHMTYRNVHRVVTSKTRYKLTSYIIWMLAVLSSVDGPLAEDSFLLTNVDTPG